MEKQAKLKLTLSMIFLIALMSVIAYAIVTVEYVQPADEKILIKSGTIEGNITFEANSTPSGFAGNITNMTLWTNISGTWKANYTNDTTSTMGAETNRIFDYSDTSIFSGNLADELNFKWNVQACDNKTEFIEEDVVLQPDFYTILDNTTATPNNYSVIVTAGRGRVINYPLISIDDVGNTTGGQMNAGCVINGTDGYFYCNQTINVYNSTGGFRYAENLIEGNTVKVNYTITSEAACRFVGNNRTVSVQDAPSVTLNSPDDNAFDDDGTIVFNFTVTGDSDTYTCQVYSNDTGTWHIEGAAIATNNSYKLSNQVITEGNGIVWNVICAETAKANIRGWALANRTITVDKESPDITIISPADGVYVSGNESPAYDVSITINVTDANPHRCVLKLNGTLNSTGRDSTSYTSGTPQLMNFNASDNTYAWNVECNNTAGLLTVTANRTITLDSTRPKITRNVNYTSSNANCEGFTVDFTISEEANVTFTYGLTSGSETYTTIETDYATNQTVTLTFNTSYEAPFFANITMCDRSGNCNNTVPELNLASPIPVCTGWSLWSVYDAAINLSDYRIASTADYVYFWNNSGQDWIYSSAAGSSHSDHNMMEGDVVQLYESTNTTYFRNNTANAITNKYYRNLTGGHAYFGLYEDYMLGNFSTQLFRNETGGNVTPSILGYTGIGGGIVFNVDWFSSFNNSNQLYVDSPFRWSWNNDTVVGNASKNGLDTLWAYVNYNISINFTRGGEIVGNWSESRSE